MPDRGEEARDGCPAGDAGAVEATEEVRELLEAIQEYQRTSKRMFPTWSEVLEIMQQLGYRKPE